MTPIPGEPAYDLIVASPNAAVDSYYLLRRLEVGDVTRAEKTLHTAGGKGNNLARAVKALGGRVLSLGIVGGHTGRFVVAELDREGIAHDVVWTARETRRSSTLISLDRQQTTVVLDSGDQADPEAAAGLIQLVRAHAHQAPYLVLTGSLPLALPARYYADLIDQAGQTPGLQTCLDCAGEALRLAAQCGVDLIKINLKEFQASFLGSSAWTADGGQAVFDRLQPAGLKLLIVTDGPRGAYIFSEARPSFQVCTPVETWISTAGAGDTFMAGLLVRLNRGAGLEEAARYASAAAAAALQQTVCGCLVLEDVDRYLLNTRVTALEPTE